MKAVEVVEVVTRPFDVLLVEDNPGDVRLMREALSSSQRVSEIHVAENGLRAVEMLRSHLRGQRPWPDIVLLDLNLPGKNGHEVLAEVRADPDLHLTPVIVFTSSAAEQDINRAYELRANCFVTKPASFAELTDTIQEIEQFWLHTVCLPSRAAES